MTVKRTKIWRLAYVLDASALQRIDLLLGNHCGTITFEFKCKDESKSTYTFKSSAEAIAFPNSKEHPISKLTIWGREYPTTEAQPADVWLSFDHSFLGSVYLTVSSDDESAVIFLMEKLGEIIGSLEASYSRLSLPPVGFTFISYAIVLSIFIGMGLEVANSIDQLLESLKSEPSETATALFRFVYLGVIWLFLYLLASLDDYRSKLCPIAVFAIGDGEKRYQRQTDKRRSISGVLLPSLFGAILALVSIALSIYALKP